MRPRSQRRRYLTLKVMFTKSLNIMRRFSPAVFLICAATACGSDDSEDTASTAVVDSALTDYKKVVHANYAEVVASAKQLETAIAAFTAAPSETTLKAAKDAWIAARVPYGPSEAFRFYEGPIDNEETGPEGLVNAWPLDENYIDYTRDAPTAGIISSTAPLTAESIEAANEMGGEKMISTGYHAIEFLLWGQDDATPGTGSGKRSFTDYTTAPNAERRRTYLTRVTELLVQHLEEVAAAWTPNVASNYAARFGVTPSEAGNDARDEALGNILRALGSMAKAELSGERMTVAYVNHSEEDEHSCFSDNTAADLLGNGEGLQNVWLGTYGSFDGVGIDEVVKAVNAKLATRTTADIADAVAKLQVLADLQDRGTPIDMIVVDANDASVGRKAMLAAIQALKKVADDVEQAARALGLSVTLEEPSETL
jgi:putative iron-regulated protein